MLVHNAGMATMIYRCTFALDESTTARIRHLATLWDVSQAEVIRRAVANAATPPGRPDPAERLSRLHESGGGLSKTVAQSYLGQVRADRKQWRHH